MGQSYVEHDHGGYWVAGTRVSLDSIVYRWREGLAPETIQRECFTTLTLAQVFGALAYYLDHQAEIDEHLQKAEAEEKVVAEQLREQYPDIHRKLDEILQNAKNRARCSSGSRPTTILMDASSARSCASIRSLIVRPQRLSDFISAFQMMRCYRH